MVYCSPEDTDNRGEYIVTHPLDFTPSCLPLQIGACYGHLSVRMPSNSILLPGAIVVVDSSYKLAIGGKRDRDNPTRDGYSRNFYQVFNVMVRIGEVVFRVRK